MKKPMSAAEWFYKNYKTSTINVVKLMESYSTYLINFHLEQFAEECKSKVQLTKSSNCGSYLDAIVDIKSIDQTLTDYKLKNNIK